MCKKCNPSKLNNTLNQTFFCCFFAFLWSSPKSPKFSGRTGVGVFAGWGGSGIRAPRSCQQFFQSWIKVMKQTHLKDCCTIKLVQMIPLTSPASWYDDSPGWFGWPESILPTFYCAPKDRPGRGTIHHFLAEERNHAHTCHTATWCNIRETHFLASFRCFK